ncbi:MAG TPA: hypothetical protein VMW24_19310 [Sedimentisphaerales bacterium]|nr:hypothetical protein [Sedimentisphaerales bacterium]
MMWESIKTWLDHNQGLAVAAVISIGLCVFCYGCESRVASLTTPGQKVNRAELQVELQTEQARLSTQLDALQTKAAAKEQSLDKQDELKQGIAQIGLAVAQGGEINPVGIAVSILGLAGIGLAVDNRAKDKVIKVQKAANGGTESTT